MCQPDIYLYNPTCDFAIANGTGSWQPNKLLARMEADTANLPQFLCRKEDVVLVRQHPSGQLLQHLAEAGFTIPAFRTLAEVLSESGFPGRTIGTLRPWGWSPEVHARLSPLKKLCGEGFWKSPVSDWTEMHRELSSRQTAREVLSQITGLYPFEPFIQPEYLPVKCLSVRDVELQASRWGSLMVKMPWSSSGRGLQKVTHCPLNISTKQRISGMLREQGYVFAEPFLDKKMDLGLLYEAGKSGIRFLGFSRFFTNPKGQYRGNYLNGYPEKLSEEENAVLHLTEKILPEIHTEALQKLDMVSYYQGPVGIDTMIFNDHKGKLRIQPCVEINWRYTMGHLSLKLEKQICQTSKAIFGTYYSKEKAFPDFSKENILKNPLEMQNGKICAGFLPLTEFHGDPQFGAYLEVMHSS